MKITGLKTLQLQEFPQLLWLVIETDAGIMGLGETFFAPAPVAAYLHDNVAAYLLGQDPRDVERHDWRLRNVYVGSTDAGAEMRGNSAVNIALWDILARSLDSPLWRVLGGKVSDTVPLYNTCAGYSHVRASKRHALFERNEDWSLKPGGSEEGPYEDLLGFRYDAGKLADSLLAEGIGAMKIWPFDIAAEATNGARITGPELDAALEPLNKIRATVGNRIEIMIELHGLWSLPCALAIADALRPFRPAWLEEPIRFNDVDALATLARHTPIPIAASERLASRGVFRRLIEKRAASVIMIDLAWCGGLGEARKIAHMAEASQLPITLHDCTGPIVFAASCALSATLPNVNWQEAVRAYYGGWYREIVDTLPSISDGRVTPLAGAGLGLTLRPELFTRKDALVKVSRC